MRVSKDSQNSHDQSKFSILLTYVRIFSDGGSESTVEGIFCSANWTRPKSLLQVDFVVKASVKCT